MRAASNFKRCVFIGATGLLLIVFGRPAAGLAQEAWTDITVGVRYASPIAEQAVGVPWSDVYRAGTGLNLEVSRRNNPFLAILAGVSYDRYSGKNILRCCPNTIGKFSDQNPLTLYLGWRVYLIARPDLTRVDPYFRADFGYTRFSAVRFNGAALGASKSGFSLDIGAGVDVRIFSALALYAEMKYQDYGKPAAATDSFRAVPISIGVRVGF